MKKFIIIGAGILGASTAYHLAKSGVEVTVVDRMMQGRRRMPQRVLFVHGCHSGEIKPGMRLQKAGRHIMLHLFSSSKKMEKLKPGTDGSGAVSLHTDAVKLEKMEERAIKRRDDAPEIGDIRQLNCK